MILKLRNKFKKKKELEFFKDSINNILVLFDDKNKDLNVEYNTFFNATSFLKEDYKFDKHAIGNQVLDIKFFNDYDFVIVLNNCIEKLTKQLKILKKISVPKGIVLSKKTKIENLNTLKYYEVIWCDDFDFLDNLTLHSRKFYVNCGTSFRTTTKGNEPDWDIRFYSNQLKKGIDSLVSDNVRVSKRIFSNKNLKVGRNSFYNSNFTIFGKDSYVEIGSFCSFGNNLKLYISNHDVNFASTQGYLYRKFFNSDHPGENRQVPSISRSKGAIVIKNDVWIGDDVKLMSGITIGNGACIAAGSIVTSDVNDYEIVGGCPARTIKYRFSNEIISYLNDIKWWEWSDKKIKNNQDFFNLNLNDLQSVNDIKKYL